LNILGRECSVVAKDRGSLGKLADQIRKESPLPLFPCTGLPSESGRILWFGDDVRDFFAIAKSVGAPLLYLVELTVEEGEEKPAERDHVGETSYVEASFLFDGQFHSFLEIAEWAAVDEEEGTGTDRTEDSTEAATAIESRKEELVREFRAELEKGPKPIDTGQFSIEQGFRRFVFQKLRGPGGRLPHLGSSIDGSPAALLVQKIASDLSMELHSMQVEEERATVDSLITECVVWAKDSGLTSAALGDIETFLDQKRVRITREGVRLLWNRVRTALRVGRTSSR
jgi:hypothetical protein